MENNKIVSDVIQQLIISQDFNKQLLTQIGEFFKSQNQPKKKKSNVVSENQLSLPLIQQKESQDEPQKENTNSRYKVGDRLVFKSNKNLISEVIKVTDEDIEVLCFDTNKTKILKQSYSKRYYVHENTLDICSGQKWRGYAQEVKDKIIEIDSVHYINDEVDYIIPKNSRHHQHKTVNKKIKLRSLVTRYNLIK